MDDDWVGDFRRFSTAGWPGIGPYTEIIDKYK
jgi:hypothetical protein